MATSTDFEIIVIGGGVAGLTAALFAARLGRRTLVLMQLMPGGQLATISRIEDYPGFPEGVAGYDLGPMLQEQAVGADAECRTADVERIEPTPSGWRAITDQGELTARVVILATGSRIRTLDVPGEARFAGKGVSHCASCDGPLLRGKPVVVVGAGDAGLQEALTLASSVESVTIVDRAPAPPGQASYRSRVAAESKIHLQCNTIVEEILGDAAVTGVRLRDLASGAPTTLPAEAVFVYAGVVANTDLVATLVDLDADGRIVVNSAMQTSRAGLYAAGDVRAGSVGQAITAAGDGATAAIAAHGWLAAGAPG